MRLPLAIPLALLSFVGMDSLVFHTSLYPSIAQPDASTGMVPLVLQNELHRQAEPNRDPSKHILAIGDSRMGGFLPRVANEAKLGYTFSSISVPAATPRCWYYMLREVDPDANRYRSVIIPMQTYDDTEELEPYGDRMLDINLLAAELRWSDLAEFAGSYDMPDRRREAALEIALRGIVYRDDLQQFLEHPGGRLKTVAMNRKDSATWFYEFKGPETSMKDIHIDWATKTLTVPPGTTPDEIERFRRRFFDPYPPQEGRWAKYLDRWIGKIVDHYKGSQTRLVFIRLPRGPFIRPDTPGPNPNSLVRRLSKQPGIAVTPESTFNNLEKPELFVDELHLNGPGSGQFSAMLAKLVVSQLQPRP